MSVQQYDHAIFKVWFGGASTSRNFDHVMEIARAGDAMTITTSSGNKYLLNWSNINMIEEIHP